MLVIREHGGRRDARAISGDIERELPQRIGEKKRDKNIQSPYPNRQEKASRDKNDICQSLVASVGQDHACWHILSLETLATRSCTAVSLLGYA